MLKYRNYFFPRLHKLASAFVVPKALLMAIAFLAMWSSVSAQSNVVIGPSFTFSKDAIYQPVGFGTPPPAHLIDWVDFSKLFVPGFGIYFEKLSVAGFVWSIEASRYFRNHKLLLKDIPIQIKSRRINPYVVSAQAGYRIPNLSPFTLALFTGVVCDFHFPNSIGLSQYGELDNFRYGLSNFRRGSNVMLPLRIDATMDISKNWLVSVGVTYLTEIDGLSGGNYFIHVEKDGNLLYKASYYYYIRSVIVQAGLRWRFLSE